MRCGRCGTDVPDSLTVCPECGANVRRFGLFRGSVRCRACEARVQSDLSVCPQCGTRLRRGWWPQLRALGVAALVLASTYFGIRYLPWADLLALPNRIRMPSVAFLVTPTFTLRPSATGTSTRTPTLTSTSTATAIPPTETATLPPPTATQLPTATFTPAPPFPAPRLLSPVYGAEFGGGGSSILLSWEPVGVLAADEWYSLSLRYFVDGSLQYAGAWTKEASWLVPRELYARAGQHEREFEWDVSVMLQTGSGPDGGRVGAALSPPGETWIFVWQ
jgi:RNA polymerase subunit RPABC4/transcription elongation factor Spt4